MVKVKCVKFSVTDRNGKLCQNLGEGNLVDGDINTYSHSHYLVILFLFIILIIDSMKSESVIGPTLQLASISFHKIVEFVAHRGGKLLSS